MNRLKYCIYRIICVIISIAMSGCIVFSCLLAISALTIGSDDYLLKYFSSDTVAASLSDSLEDELKPLCEDAGISSSVFMDKVGIGFIKASQEAVISGMHTRQATDFETLFNVTEKYKSAIKDYCTANSIQISDEKIEDTAQRAAEIYSQVCAIKNNSQICDCAALFSRNMFFPVIALLVCAAAGIFLEYTLNGRRRKGFNYVAMSLVTAGEIMVVLPICIMLCGVLNRLDITGVLQYNAAIAGAVKTMLIIILIVGVVFIAFGISHFAVIYRYYKFKLIDNDTEMEINKNII